MRGSDADEETRSLTRGYPRNAWYALAASAEVGREPLGTRALDRPVVLFRTDGRRVVALGDRDAHRPYPLSLGRVEGDTIVSGYSGFAYDRTGACVRVPSQEQVPYGARVPSYPVREDGGLVWVWLGEPSLAERRPPGATPWLTDPAWETFGGQWETAANVRLLHDNFADITHVAVVDPVISPPALLPGSRPRSRSSSPRRRSSSTATGRPRRCRHGRPASRAPRRRRRTRNGRRARSSPPACGPTAGTCCYPPRRAGRRSSASPTQ